MGLHDSLKMSTTWDCIKIYKYFVSSRFRWAIASSLSEKANRGI